METYIILGPGTQNYDGYNFPTDIVLSSSSFLENQTGGAQFVNISTIDPDIGDEHVYGLISGTGGEDNAAFTLVDDKLYSTVLFDASVKSTYNVRISATDLTGLSVTRNFVLTIINIPPEVSNPIADLSVAEDAYNNTLDLSHVFNDVDDDNASINKTATSSDPSLVAVSVGGNTLVLDYQSNQWGTADITVTGTSNGKTVSDVFTVTVNPVDDAPEVANPLPDISVNEDAANSTINLSHVFNDIDDNVSITKTATSSDPSLVTVSIADNNLTLDYQSNQSGTANITVTGTSNGKVVSDFFSVTLNPVDDAPEVANPLPDISVNEDADNSTINLSHVFNDIDDDNASITKTATSGEPSLVTLSIADNNLTLDYQTNQSGIANITVTGTSNGQSVSDVFTVTVNAVNDRPVVANPLPDISVNEDAANSTIDLSHVFNDIDDDNASITKTATSGDPSLVTVSVAGGNTLILDYQLNQWGTANITVTGTSNGKTVDDVFTVIVNAVNDDPVVANPLPDISVNEDAANSTINLSHVFNDFDDDNASINKTATSGDPSLVTASVAGGNTLILDYQLNQSGTANITVTGTSNGKTVDDIFTVTVNPVDDDPVVANPLPDISVNEDAANSTINLSHVFNDIDDDNASITKTAISSDPSLVTLSIADNNLTLNYQSNQSGTANITVTGTSNGKSVDDTFTVTINAVDDDPVVANPLQNISVDEDAANSTIDLSHVFNDIDDDNASINKTATSGDPSLVTASVAGGNTLILDYQLNQSGTANITVTGTSNGKTVDDIFTVTVNPVDDDPVVANPLPDISVNEDAANSTINLSHVFNDIDHDNASITKTATSGDPSLVAISVVGNTLTLDYQSNQSGTTDITVTGTSNGLSVSDFFTVTINAVDDDPVVANPLQDISVNEDAADSTIDLSHVFDDIDDDNTSITKTATSGDPSLVTASLQGNTLILDYQTNQSGTTDITVTGTSNGQSVSDTFTVTINAVDDAPVILNPLQDISVDEDAVNSTINLSHVFNDIDDDNASITKTATSGDPSLVTVSVGGNTLILDYQTNQSGTADITITGTSNGKSVSDFFTVTVNAVDDDPVVANPLQDISVNEDAADSTIDLSHAFNDIDDNNASITKTATSSDPSLVAASVAGGNTLILDYQTNQSGTTDITVTGTSNGKTVDDTFTVTINAVDDAPVVANPLSDISVNEDAADSTIDLSHVFNDIDDDNISITKAATSGDPSLVTASVAGGNTLILDYQTNQSGTTDITVTGTSNGQSVSDTFTVTVNAVDDDPVVANPLQDISVNEDAADSTINLSHVFDDIDDDNASITKTATSGDPSLVTASVAGGNTLILDYQLNQSGIADITLTGTSNGQSVSDVFTVTVNAVDDDPLVANPLPDISVNEDAANSTINLSHVFNDIDDDNASINKTATSDSPSLVAVSVADNNLTLDYQTNQSGTTDITVTGTSNGQSVSDTFTVTINAVDDAPVVANPLQDISVNEDAADSTINLSHVFNDNDDDNASITKTALSSNPSLVTASVAGGNTLILNYQTNQWGTAGITITGTSNGKSVSDFFTVTVNAVDDAPVVANPLQDISVNEDAADSTIDLSHVFDDIDDDNASITKTATSSDPSLVTVSVAGGNTLTLDYQTNQSGIANITVTGTSTGKSVSDVFTVTVNAVDDAPVIVNPLPDISVNEDAVNSQINLSNVFNNVDNNASITKTATSSDPSLVIVSVADNNLTLNYQTNQSGTADITVTGTSNGKSVSDIFTVTVNAVDDAPEVVNPLEDISVNEDAANSTIDLSHVFNDIDDYNASINKTAYLSNPSLVSASVLGNTITLDYQLNQSGTADITVTGTSNGKSVSDVFSVTVSPVDDAPVVANPLPDISVNEDAANSTIDLSHVFNDIDDDNASINKTATSGDPSLVTVSVAGGNTLILDYQSNQSGTTSITVTGTSNGKSVSDFFTVTVNPMDDAPVVANPLQNISVDEDTANSTINLYHVFNDIDDDNASINKTATSGDPSLVAVSVAGGNTLILDYQPNQSGTADINVTGISNGKSVSDVFSVTINAVDDDPVVANPLPDISVDEDAADSTINLSNVFNDIDDNNASITKTATSGDPSLVTVSVAGGNTLILDYQLNQSGTTDITVTGTSNGLSVSDFFTVTVNAVNDRPVVANPLPDISVNEDAADSTINLSHVFNDIDDDNASISKTATSSDPSLVAVSVAGGNTLILDYQSNQSGTANIFVTGTSNGKTVSDVFTVTVNPVDDVPEVANPLPDISVNEDAANSTINLYHVFNDIDDDNASINKTATSSDPSLVTVSVADNNLTLNYQTNQSGTADINVTGISNGKSVSDVFTVTINAVDDAPVVANLLQDISVNEDATDSTIDLSNVFNDIDDDNASITKTATSSDPSLVTASVVGGNTLILDYQSNQMGTVNITVTGTSRGKTVDDTFSVTVSPVDDRPVVANPLSDISVNEDAADSTIDLSLVFNDIDDDNASINKTATSSDPSLVTLSVADNNLTLNYQSNQSGTANITVTGTSNGKSVSDIFTVTINAVDDAPAVVNSLQDRSVDEDSFNSIIDLSHVFNDIDDDNASINKTATSGDPSLVTVFVAGNILALDYQSNQSGTANITLTGTSNGKTVSDVFSVTVSPVDDDPVVANPLPDISVNEDAANSTIDLSLVFNDIDDDNASINKTATSTNPSLVSASVVGNILALDCQTNQSGSAYIIVTGTSNGKIGWDVFSVTVNPVDDAPVVANLLQDISVNEDATDSTINLSHVFNDIDDDNASINKTATSSDPSLITVSVAGGNTLILDYQSNQSGTADINVTGTSNGKTVDDTFTITINAVDDDPVVANPLPDISVNEDATDSTINLSHVFNDIDDDNASITKTATSSYPSLITVSVAGENTLILDYQLNQSGTASITVTGTSNGKTVDDTFTVTINAVDDDLVVANPLPDISVNEDAANSTINLSHVFNDIDDDNASITKTASSSDPSLVAVSVVGNALTLNYQSYQSGTANITVTGTSNGKTVNDTFTVTVNAVDDDPVVVNPLPDISVKEDATDSTIDLSHVFNDIDDDNASINKTATSSDPSLITVSVAGENTLVLDYQPNQSGTADITVTGTSNGKTVDDTFTVTINAVDDDPVVANPLPDISVNEDAADSTIDLSNVFNDIDDDNASINKNILTINHTEINLVTDPTRLAAQVLQSSLENLQLVSAHNGNTPFLSEKFVSLGDLFFHNDASSEDGINWVPFVTNHNYWLNGLGYEKGLYIITGPQGQLFTSQDGINFTKCNTPDSDDLTGITFGNGVYLIRKYWQAGKMLASNDGILWSTQDTEPGGTPDKTNNNISGGNGYLVFVVPEGVRVSQDGISWAFQPITHPYSSGSMPDVSYHKDAFYTVSVDDPDPNDKVKIKVGRSLNGSTWNFNDFLVDSSTSLSFKGIFKDQFLFYGSETSTNFQQFILCSELSSLAKIHRVTEGFPQEIISRMAIGKKSLLLNTDAGNYVSEWVEPHLLNASLDGNTLTLNYLPHKSGSANITVTGTSNGKTVEDTFTVTIHAVDDDPVVANPINDIIVDEDSADSIIDLSHVFNDADDDNDSITKSVLSSNNSLINASVVGNILTLNYQTNQTGSADITLTGTSNGKSVNDVFTVTVNAVDDEPVVANPLIDIIVNENSSDSIIDLSHVFNDEDDDNASITKSVLSSNNSLVNATVLGNMLTLNYQPNQSGSATITLTATSNGKTVEDIFTVTVNALVEAPIITNPLSDFIVDEDSINSTINLTNVFHKVDDNASITKIALSSNPSLVTASVLENTLTLDYLSNKSGTANITVTGTSNGKSVSDSFTVTVNAVDDPPVVANPLPNITTLEDSSDSIIDLSNVFSDVDDNNASIVKTALSADPSMINVSLHNNLLTLNYLEKQWGTTRVIVTGTSNGKSVEDIFYVTVMPFDNPPVVVNPLNDLTVGEDSEDSIIDLSHVFTDVDDNDTSITKSVHSSNTSLVIASLLGNILTLDHQPSQWGFAKITVTGTSNGKSVNDLFNVTVMPVDDPPVVANPLSDIIVNQYMADDFVIDLSNVFNDVDNVNASITKSVHSSNTSSVTASVVGNKLILGNNLKQSGFANITVTATSNGKTVVDDFNFTVIPVYYDPVVLNPIPDFTLNEDDFRLYPDTQTNPEVTSRSIDLSRVFNDIDNDNELITYTVHSTNTSLITVDVTIDDYDNSKWLTLDYQPNQSGVAIINVTAMSNGKTVEDEFTITINPIDDAPNVAYPLHNFSRSVLEDSADSIIDLSQVFYDVDNDDSNITKIAYSSDLSLVTTFVQGNSLTLDYQPNQSGFASITVIATSNGKSVMDGFSVQITPVDDSPGVVNPLNNNISVDEDSADSIIDLSQIFYDIDDDNASITYSAYSSDTSLVTTFVQGNTLTLDYQPNQSGSTGITVTGTSNGKTVSEFFTVTVNAMDDYPGVVNPLSNNISVDEDSADSIIDLSQIFYDIDDDNASITYSAYSSDPSKVTAFVQGNTLTLDYQPNQSGSTGITVTGTSNGKSVSDVFMVELNAVDDSPVVANPLQDISVNEDAADSTIDLSHVFNDIDDDNASITYSAYSSDPSKITAFVQGNTLTLDYQPNQLGSTGITVTGISNGKSASDLFMVAVSPVDYGLVVANPLQDISVNEDAADSTIDLSHVFNDIDDDNASITYSAYSSDPSKVTAFVQGNILTLDYQAQSGIANITVVGTSNGKSISNIFSINIRYFIRSVDALATESLGSNWYYSNWFGYFYDGRNGWFHHSHHGWIYIVANSEYDIWIYDQSIGWMYTRKNIFPYLFMHGSSSWIYDQSSTSKRVFWDYKSLEYFSISKN